MAQPAQVKKREMVGLGGISVCVKVGELEAGFPDTAREPMSPTGIRCHGG